MVKRILFFSASHFFVLLICFSISFVLGMSRLDAIDENISSLETFTFSASEVLLMPALFLIREMGGINFSNMVQWLLFFGNSILWGVVIYFAYRIFSNEKVST
jgi:hypothetical protein